MHIIAYRKRQLLITEPITGLRVKVLVYNLLLYKIDIVLDDEMYIIIYITSKKKIMYIIYNNIKYLYIHLFYISI